MIRRYDFNLVIQTDDENYEYRGDPPQDATQIDHIPIATKHLDPERDMPVTVGVKMSIGESGKDLISLTHILGLGLTAVIRRIAEKEKDLTLLTRLEREIVLSLGALRAADILEGCYPQLTL